MKRITVSLPDELVEKIVFELMDGKLGTPEEMKAFLEPYSPPAPPPPVHLRRAREIGCKIVVNTDAHATEELDQMRFGITQLRRAWLTAGDVLNTLPTVDALLAQLRPKP